MTSRIRFRELCMGDANRLYEIYSDKEAMKYRGSKAMETMEEAKEFVRNVKLLKGQTLTIRLGIELVRTKELLGSVMYRFNRNRKNECVIGYSIAFECWRQGFGKEIVQLMLEELAENKEISNIVAWSNRANIASIKILKKRGFHLVEQAGMEDKYLFQRKEN